MNRIRSLISSLAKSTAMRLAALVSLFFAIGVAVSPPRAVSAPTPVNKPAFVPATAGMVTTDGGSLASLTPGDAGDMLTTTSGGQWGKVSGSGWVTLLDCDLTAQSTQNLNTGGTFTMCGLTPWKNEPANNTAVTNGAQNYITNPTGTLDLTNGSGLVFGQILAAASQWGPMSGSGNNDNRGGSAVWLSLANLGIPSSFTWTSQLRMWVNVSSQTIAECIQQAGLVIGVDNDPYHGGSPTASSPKWVGLYGARTCTSTTNPAFHADVVIGSGSSSSVSSSATGQTSWNTSNATTVVYTGPIGRFGGNTTMPLVLWQSQYSGGWANENTLIPWAASQRSVGDGQNNDNGIGFMNADGGTNLLNRFGIVLAAHKTTTATAGSITVSRLRVDYKL